MNREQYIKLYNNPDMYDQWDVGRDHPRSKFLLDNIQEGSVLELGCGGSGFIRLLADSHPHIVAVDVNPKWIKLGQERLPQVQYYYSLIEEFYLEERFDNVLLMEVLEHVLDPEAAIDTALAHLAPQGLLLATVPQDNTKYTWVDNHARAFSESTLASLVPENYKTEISSHDETIFLKVRYWNDLD